MKTAYHVSFGINGSLEFYTYTKVTPASLIKSVKAVYGRNVGIVTVIEVNMTEDEVRAQNARIIGK